MRHALCVALFLSLSRRIPSLFLGSLSNNHTPSRETCECVEKSRTACKSLLWKGPYHNHTVHAQHFCNTALLVTTYFRVPLFLLCTTRNSPPFPTLPFIENDTFSHRTNLFIMTQILLSPITPLLKSIPSSALSRFTTPFTFFLVDDGIHHSSVLNYRTVRRLWLLSVSGFLR